MKEADIDVAIRCFKTGTGGLAAHHRQEYGYSLMEVLITLLILVVVLIPLLRLFITGSISSTEARQRTTALNLAQGVMELYRNEPFSELANLINNEGDGQSYSYTLPSLEDYTRYQRAVIITSQTYTSQADDLYRIEATVDLYANDLNRTLWGQMAVAMQTYRADY